MSAKTDSILSQLKSLTQLETTELVKQIEQTFGVEASPTKVICISELIPPPPDDPVETEFDVVLEEVPANKKIAILMVLRSLTGLGLKEAKEFVESVPKVVKGGLVQDAAVDIKQQLEAAGAQVSLK